MARQVNSRRQKPPDFAGRTLQPVLAFSTVCFCILAGCAGMQSHYRDVDGARRAAYDRWLASRQAQTDDTQPRLSGELSLEDALKLALSNNKTLRAARQEKDMATGTIVAAYSNVLPSVDATADYTRLDMVTSFDVGGQSVSFGDVDNYSINLKVSQPLFRGGAIGAALNAAQLFAALTDQRVRGAVQEMIFGVARRYFDVLLARHLYQVELDAVKSAEGQLEDVERKRSEGVASDFDVLRARVDLSNFRAQMIQRKNAAGLAMTALLRAMGVSQESDVTLSDRLEHVPVRQTLEDAVRTAYLNRPDLYQAEFNVRLQKEALNIARSTYWPSVDAFFENRWSKPDPHESTVIEWGYAWTAGVTAIWHLFDGLAREGRVMQEEAKLRQAEINLVDVQERALEEIRNALLNLQDAEEFVQSQKLSLDQASEGLRLAEVGYREGVNTAVDLLDARTALTRAQGFYYDSIYRHIIARLQLAKAMGVLGPHLRTGAERPGEDAEQPADTAPESP